MKFILSVSAFCLVASSAVAAPAIRLPAKRTAPVARKPAPIVSKPVPVRNGPGEFIASRAQRVLAALKSRPMRIGQNSERLEIKASTSKQAWIDGVYSKNLIEASWATQMLSDKRILFEVLTNEMGSRTQAFYPKTLGLREFLARHRLVDRRGQIVQDGDRIDDALHEEFPAGFIVRPAVGVAPNETGRGLFVDSDAFIMELLRPGTALYAPSHYARPVRSHILGTVASGEGVVLQENFVNASDIKNPLKVKYFKEVRIHTYEGRVIDHAIPKRWVQSGRATKEEIRGAERFVAQFLEGLSSPFLNKQAFGVDVAVLDNGDVRINDVVTNRGRAIAWSGYLDQPRVIGAYTRHFENNYGVKFRGVSGFLIRHNMANYFSYWNRRIEMAKPGVSKAMAFFPPWP